MARQVYDVAVVGLGAVGASALYQVAKRGARVIGIDRYAPPHDRGSSHGESRIMRQGIGEGEAYVPLVLRSNAIWEELEAATGKQLLERCGFLLITRDDFGTSHHGKSGFLERTRHAAATFGIAHAMLGPDDLRARFPQFIGLIGDEHAYFEPGGGYIRPEQCIAASLAEAQRRGATVVTGRRVDAIDRQAGAVSIRVGAERLVARHVIVATGGWIGELVGGPLRTHVDVHRQILHWFDVEDASRYRPGASPTFLWTHGLTSVDQFYGFPPIDGRVKVAREDYSGAYDPDTAARDLAPDQGTDMASRHVAGRLAGVSAQPTRSAVCHYAVTPDADFIIDPDGPVSAVSACSGHGFKHAAAVGEVVAQIALGEPAGIDIAPFSSSRFSI